MISLQKYIQLNKVQINEGVFDTKPVTYKDFVVANQQLDLCNLDKANIQDKSEIEKMYLDNKLNEYSLEKPKLIKKAKEPKSEIEKMYFNTDLKLPNGSTVKKQVNANKAMFKKFNLANFVEGKSDNDMEKLLVDIGKADIEIGDDTYSNNQGSVIVRRLETDEVNKIMMIITFKA